MQESESSPISTLVCSAKSFIISPFKKEVKAQNQSRFELKFVVPLAQGEDIINELRYTMAFDSNADASGRYAVRSLYLDSPELKDYHDVLNGEKQRCKFRFRKYDLNSPKILLEAKHKYNAAISKTRIWLDALDMEAFWKDPFEEREGYNFFGYHFGRYGYAPLVTVSYQRIPLHDIVGEGVRVTLDYNLRCGGPDMFMRAISPSDKRILPPGYGVLEVKLNRGMPSWLRLCIERNNLVARPYTKYGTAIDRYINDQPLIQELSKQWMNF